ncbi:hypothetical protein WJ56_09225 [Burkholderia ubonensis]|uniref:PRTRC system protein E n=1 Tax=Burkholderia ubonensis TaxID=101571 RepID=UPI00075D0BF9|nr:PRTRC system protein E [Burkholderia ubonensis]KVM05506.1 hypothetical protein WJ51_26330 [Burkholderia ubonensis]KVM09650.1 hypothetical protein WJ52_23630 [Burkholderia ubonensis]KVM53163.1 hypothetical protein WJ56_09225 [Burkholderia ubonensis]
MSLFTSLHELARATSINILITAESDETLRVNVTPLPNGKGEKKLWPLSLVATPEELDAEFATAVEAYEPGALSLLDQARACAAANQSGSAPALQAPSAGQSAGNVQKRRGRPPKAAKPEATDAPPTNNDAAGTDPRQMSIDDAQQTAAGTAPAAEAPAPTEAEGAEQLPKADDALDMY